MANFYLILFRNRKRFLWKAHILSLKQVKINTMRITKYLLILLLILFPFGEILRFDLGNNVFLKPLDVISLLLLVWTVILYVKNKSFRKSLQWYYFFFPLMGIESKNYCLSVSFHSNSSPFSSSPSSSNSSSK